MVVGLSIGTNRSSGGVEMSEGAPNDEDDDGRSHPKTLFVEEIADFVACHKVRNLFVKYGQLLKVFIQRAKKMGRRLGFGFVHFFALES